MSLEHNRKSIALIIGVCLTVAYSVFLFWILFIKYEELHRLDLNEIGDFLAGASAPLAFLWLVIGILQQQIGLKQNTEMLGLQAEELSKSVASQEEMSRIAKLQMVRDRPLFAIDSDERFVKDQEGDFHPVIAIQNWGHTALRVKLKMIGRLRLNGDEDGELVKSSWPHLSKDMFVISCSPVNSEDGFVIFSQDVYGNESKQYFAFLRRYDDEELHETGYVFTELTNPKSRAYHEASK